MDEPFPALDVQERVLRYGTLPALSEQVKGSVEFVARDFEGAIALADGVHCGRRVRPR